MTATPARPAPLANAKMVPLTDPIPYDCRPSPSSAESFLIP
jgi:hypothetical protein